MNPHRTSFLLLSVCLACDVKMDGSDDEVDDDNQEEGEWGGTDTEEPPSLLDGLDADDEDGDDGDGGGTGGGGSSGGGASGDGESDDGSDGAADGDGDDDGCLLYTSPSPRDRQKSRMPSSA